MISSNDFDDSREWTSQILKNHNSRMRFTAKAFDHKMDGNASISSRNIEYTYWQEKYLVLLCYRLLNTWVWGFFGWRQKDRSQSSPSFLVLKDKAHAGPPKSLNQFVTLYVRNVHVVTYTKCKHAALGYTCRYTSKNTWITVISLLCTIQVCSLHTISSLFARAWVFPWKKCRIKTRGV